jgi:hypothetical protein
VRLHYSGYQNDRGLQAYQLGDWLCVAVIVVGAAHFEGKILPLHVAQLAHALFESSVESIRRGAGRTAPKVSDQVGPRRLLPRHGEDTTSGDHAQDGQTQATPQESTPIRDSACHDGLQQHQPQFSAQSSSRLKLGLWPISHPMRRRACLEPGEGCQGGVHPTWTSGSRPQERQVRIFKQGNRMFAQVLKPLRSERR